MSQAPTQDPHTGRFVHGNGGGPGRMSLPEWAKAKGPQLLELQMQAALEGRVRVKREIEGDDGPQDVEAWEAVSAKVAAAIRKDLLDRIYGRPVAIEHELNDDQVNDILARLYAAADDVGGRK